jgi:hypothetical protein
VAGQDTEARGADDAARRGKPRDLDSTAQGGSVRTPAHKDSSESFSPYVMTHCTTCAAGWTRKADHGETVIFCLLDREPVWPEMAECDRYESREAAE